MDEDPFTVATNGDRDGFHERAALGVSVAGTVVVEVAAPQAVRAVVAVRGARGTHRHVQAAVAAAERVGLPIAGTATLIA
jgi:hypothetical protein